MSKQKEDQWSPEDFVNFVLMISANNLRRLLDGDIQSKEARLAVTEMEMLVENKRTELDKKQLTFFVRIGKEGKVFTTMLKDLPRVLNIYRQNANDKSAPLFFWPSCFSSPEQFSHQIAATVEKVMELNEAA